MESVYLSLTVIYVIGSEVSKENERWKSVKSRKQDDNDFIQSA